MNLLLNMKDINKILAKIHFKCKYKKNVKKNPYFCENMSMTLLEVSLSCLHFSFMVSEAEVKSPCFFASVVSPVYMYHLHTLRHMSYVYLQMFLTRQGNTSTIEAIFLYSGYGRVAQDVGHNAKRLVLQCINGMSSNPVEGRTKICQLKDLILTLFGLIFRRIYIWGVGSLWYSDTIPLSP